MPEACETVSVSLAEKVQHGLSLLVVIREVVLWSI